MASIKQKSERKYKITVCNGYRSDGKKISKAKTITVPKDVPARRIKQYISHEAELFEREFQQGYSEDANTSFEVYAERWLTRQSKYAASTLAGYSAHLRMVYPHIGHISLCRIRPVTIENLCIELRKHTFRGRVVQEQTVQKYLSTVAVVLSDAKKNEIIPRNPAHMIELPRVIKKKQRIPCADEIKRLILILQNEPIAYRTYYMLALYTGCRRGELCALTWCDLAGDIEITKSCSYARGIGIFEKAPKNGRSRIIAQNEWISRLNWALARVQCDVRGELSTDDKVFTHDDGTPIHPDTFSKRLRKILDTNGFDRDFHLHSLRHFFTTYQLQNNISKQVVADIVGHADTGYLERTYCHPQDEYKIQAANVMSSFLALSQTNEVAV